MDMELIKKLVKASGVKEGELILVHYWGEDDNLHIMRDFSVAIAELGASPIVLHQSRLQNSKIFSEAKETSFSDNYFSAYEHVDAVLDVFTYQPVVLKYQISEEKMNMYRTYMRNLFNTLMKASRFTQIRIPTKENAEESILDPQDYIERMTKAYNIDYEKLKVTCHTKIAELRAANEIELNTGDNCSLRLVTKNREWIADCGDGDLPCGEIYVAPLEEETNGTIYYEKLHLEDVGQFQEVMFIVEEGVIIHSNIEEINEFLSSLPRESKVICELGFGLNENVTSLCGYTLLDEKMKDTFHIAIGNNTMFGGQNKADIHIDMVGFATVEIH